MITSEAARIFVKYGGNSDALDRMSSAYERAALSSEMLMSIENLILRLAIARTQASAESFDAETEALSSPANIAPEALAILQQFVERDFAAKP